MFAAVLFLPGCGPRCAHADDGRHGPSLWHPYDGCSCGVGVVALGPFRHLSRVTRPGRPNQEKWRTYTRREEKRTPPADFACGGSIRGRMLPLRENVRVASAHIPGCPMGSTSNKRKNRAAEPGEQPTLGRSLSARSADPKAKRGRKRWVQGVLWPNTPWSPDVAGGWVFSGPGGTSTRKGGVFRRRNTGEGGQET